MSKNVMLSQTLAAAALNAFRSNITGVSGGTTTLRLYQNPVDTDISFTLATPAYTATPIYDAVSDGGGFAQFALIAAAEPTDPTGTDATAAMGNDNVIKSFQWQHSGTTSIGYGTVGTTGTDMVLSQATVEAADSVTITDFLIKYPE